MDALIAGVAFRTFLLSLALRAVHEHLNNTPKPIHYPWRFDTNARRNLHLAMDPHRQERKTG